MSKKDIGNKVEDGIISYLEEEEGHGFLRQLDLAIVFDCSQRTVSGVIKKLQNRGRIRKNEKIRRGNLYEYYLVDKEKELLRAGYLQSIFNLNPDASNDAISIAEPGILSSLPDLDMNNLESDTTQTDLIPTPSSIADIVKMLQAYEKLLTEHEKLKAINLELREQLLQEINHGKDQASTIQGLQEKLESIKSVLGVSTATCEHESHMKESTDASDELGVSSETAFINTDDNESPIITIEEMFDPTLFSQEHLLALDEFNKRNSIAIDKRGTVLVPSDFH